MKKALKQIADLLHPVAALVDRTPFEHSEVIQRCVDALEIALEALAQPAQELTGMLHIDRLDKWLDARLKERKAQRTWVGLTDEEAQWLYNNCRTPSNLIDMVEAKLKEKNT